MRETERDRETETDRQTEMQMWPPSDCYGVVSVVSSWTLPLRSSFVRWTTRDMLPENNNNYKNWLLLENNFSGWGHNEIRSITPQTHQPTHLPTHTKTHPPLWSMWEVMDLISLCPQLEKFLAPALQTKLSQRHRQTDEEYRCILSVCLTVCLSDLSVCLFVYLSVCLFVKTLNTATSSIPHKKRGPSRCLNNVSRLEGRDR